MSATRHLVQLNVARLIAPLDDPRVFRFLSALAPINAIADRAPGFVWRLQGENGDATGLGDFGDPQLIANMSVWETADALRHFVYNTLHRKMYARRAEWFELMAQHHFVMWWVEPGEVPTLDDGMAKLDDLRANGPSADAFGWESLPNAAAWSARRCA